MSEKLSILFRAGLMVALVTAATACGSTRSSGVDTPSPEPEPPTVPTPEPPPPGPEEPPVSSDCAYDGMPVVVGDGDTRIEVERFDQCETSVHLITAELIEGAELSAGAALTGTSSGEYLEYTVQVQRSGLYTLTYRVQADNGETDGALALRSAGQTLPGTQMSVPVGEENWRDITTEVVYLSDGLQVLRLDLLQGGVGLDYLEFVYSEDWVLEPHATVADMGIGINLGNTLDAFPNEGDWALPAQEVFFDDFLAAGFRHVRIPATWNDHAGTSAPYTISAERMDRAEQIVDWALARGFYVTLNTHHERWLWEGGFNSAKQERFNAIWTQIAERFANKSSRLMFEILNEPIGLNATQTNALKAGVLPIIRASNPNRLVVISGHEYSGVHTLAQIQLPADDYLIGNFHSYDPWPFAGQCTRGWGSQQDRNELAGIYQTAQAWGQSRGVPVTLNEFGAAKYDFTAPNNVCATEDRLAYLEHHVNLATQHGIAATFWDDGGSFSTYDRTSRTWGPEKDILVAPNP